MITFHAKDRITTRLNGIITTNDVRLMGLASETWTTGKHYVTVRYLTEIVRLEDSVGNSIVAVIEDGNVKTAMLRKTTQRRYTDGQHHTLIKS